MLEHKVKGSAMGHSLLIESTNTTQQHLTPFTACSTYNMSFSCFNCLACVTTGMSSTGRSQNTYATSISAQAAMGVRRLLHQAIACPSRDQQPLTTDIPRSPVYQVPCGQPFVAIPATCGPIKPSPGTVKRLASTPAKPAD